MTNPYEIIGGVAAAVVTFGTLYSLLRDRSKDQVTQTKEQREKQEKDDATTAQQLTALKNRQDRYDRELMGEGVDGVWGETKGFIPQQREHNRKTDQALKDIGTDAKAAVQAVADLTETLQPVINEFGRNGGSTWSDAMAMINRLVREERKRSNGGSTPTGG